MRAGVTCLQGKTRNAAGVCASRCLWTQRMCIGLRKAFRLGVEFLSALKVNNNLLCNLSFI